MVSEPEFSGNSVKIEGIPASEIISGKLPSEHILAVIVL
jgi:hypothetical protein